MIHKPKPQNSNLSEKSPEQINKMEAKTAANSTEDLVKHTWEKANRTEVGGSVENMTLVQVVAFHTPVQEIIW